MSKIFYESLLKAYKRSNSTRKEVIAKKAGYPTGLEYKAFLEGEISGNVSEKTIESVEDVKPAKSVSVPTIHIVDILDCSGSMKVGKIKNANQGIKEGISKLKKEDDANYMYTFCDFSHNNDIQFSILGTPITQVIHVDKFARGYTALFDAIKKTILMVAPLVSSGEKVLVNIYTDGADNTSYTTPSQVRLLLQGHPNFILTFIGTGQDVEYIVGRLGLDESNTLTYDGTSKGLENSMKATSLARKEFTTKLAAGEDVTRGFYKNIIKK